MSLILFLASALLIVLCYIKLSPKDTNCVTKTVNVYRNRDKWYYLKYIIFLCILTIQRLRSKKHRIEDLEKIQILSDHENVCT